MPKDKKKYLLMTDLHTNFNFQLLNPFQETATQEDIKRNIKEVPP